MTRPMRVLALVGGLIVLTLALLVFLPFIFRDRIAERAKLEANRTLNARIDWRDVGLSFFRDFPNLTLRLDDFSAVGIGRFERDTLASIRHLQVALDLPSVVRNAVGKGGGPIVVRSIELDQPRLSLIKLEDGTANWDITKESAPAERQPRSERPIAISLQRFDIHDAAVAFNNRQAGLKAGLNGFTQTLTGDFSRDLVVLQSRAHADTLSLSFAGVPYLNRVRLDLTADVHADLAKKSFTLKNSGVRLNDLSLGVSGSAASAGEQLALDLAFSTPSTDFRHILSLVPAIYANDFKSVQTSGSIAVSGRVKGNYGKNAFPSFALSTKVNNGSFRYPDLPLPARDIQVDLAITNPGGDADSTVVRLNRFHLLVGRDPVDAGMVLRTPISDPDVDLRVNGKLDLADVRRTMKLEGIEQLTGRVAADAAVRTRMSYVDTRQYDKVAARGSLEVGSLTLKGKDLPHPLTIQEASLRFAPQSAELKSFRGTIGSSDLEASGSLENMLGYVLRDDVLRGNATVRSRRFDLNEWRSGEGDLQVIKVPPKIDFGLDASVGELSYANLKMTNARGKLRVKDQRVTLENFRLNTLGGEFGLNGFYETTNPARPDFDVALRMSKLQIPAAFQALTTVQLLAPVAKYAKGNFSANLQLNGALGRNMMPLFNALTGKGSLQTSLVSLQDFPPLNKVADVTKLQFLNNPTLDSVQSTFQIRDGRLQVEPFAVKLGKLNLVVSGSNGFDQSLQYALRLRVPSSEMGGAANQAITSLVSKAGKAGLDLQSAAEVELPIQITGTVKDPAVKLDAGSVVTSTKETAKQLVQQQVAKKAGVDAERLVREAEQRAATIRQQAESTAATVKRTGYEQADALVERSSNPIVRAAAEPAADRLRKEADEKAAGIIRAADEQAKSLVAEARRQANLTASEQAQ
jgi:AsmA-like C-terminal region/AsmA family